MTTTQIHDTKKSAKKATTSQDDLTDRVETIREQIERLLADPLSLCDDVLYGDIVTGAFGSKRRLVLLNTANWSQGDFARFRDWSVEQRTDYLSDIKSANEQTQRPLEYQRDTEEMLSCACAYVCTCLHGYERAEG